MHRSKTLQSSYCAFMAIPLGAGSIFIAWMDMYPGLSLAWSSCSYSSLLLLYHAIFTSLSVIFVIKCESKVLFEDF